MKTQNNKLVFGKHTVTELQNQELLSVNGGTSIIQPSITVTIAELTKQLTCGGGEDSCVTRHQ
ncbi:class I lanthipeptide [Pontimicrobium sp. MEBiC01747]